MSLNNCCLEMNQDNKYLTLNRFLRSAFGERVQKIPLDAGLTCPNRDGSKGRGGCIFCDASGSGTGASKSGRDIRSQMKTGMEWAAMRYRARKFIAYFQSFSNTYGPAEKLKALYSQALAGPEVVGLAIGTRPDCVDMERLDLIARTGSGRMVWMEYGLQSASDRTLAFINRGHTVSDFVSAVELTRRYGFLTCAHIIFGLPGETSAEMENIYQKMRRFPMYWVMRYSLTSLPVTSKEMEKDLSSFWTRQIL